MGLGRWSHDTVADNITPDMARLYGSVLPQHMSACAWLEVESLDARERFVVPHRLEERVPGQYVCNVGNPITGARSLVVGICSLRVPK